MNDLECGQQGSILDQSKGCVWSYRQPQSLRISRSGSSDVTGRGWQGKVEVLAEAAADNVADPWMPSCGQSARSCDPNGPIAVYFGFDRSVSWIIMLVRRFHR